MKPTEALGFICLTTAIMAGVVIERPWGPVVGAALSTFGLAMVLLARNAKK